MVILLSSLIGGLLDYFRGNHKPKTLWKALLCLLVIYTLSVDGYLVLLYFLAIWTGYSIGYGSPWGQVLDGRPVGVDNDSNLPDYEKWQIGPLKKSRALSLIIRGSMAGIICLDWRVSLAFGIAFLSPYVSKDWETAEFIRGCTAIFILNLLVMI